MAVMFAPLYDYLAGNALGPLDDAGGEGDQTKA